MNKRQFLKTSGAFVTGNFLTHFAPTQQPAAKPRTNWAGNLTYHTTNLFEPSTVAE